MKGKGRRLKGQVGEREFFAELNKFLPEHLRIERDLSQVRDGGVDGELPFMAIEVKRHENLRLGAWLKELRENTDANKHDPTRVLAYRQNRDSWHCLVDLDVIELACYIRWREEIHKTEETIREVGAEFYASTLTNGR